MNILMLGWELPPHNSGGLGVACYHLSKAMSLQGANIDFVVPYSAPHPAIDFMKIHAVTDIHPDSATSLGAYDSNGNYVYEDKNGISRMRAVQQKYVEYIEHFVKHNDVDVIHAHDWLTMEAGVRAKEVKNVPLIVHVHATEFDRSGELAGNPLVHEIEQAALLAADKIMAVSNITKSIIIKNYNIPADKIDVVHNAIDTSSFDAEYIYDVSTYKYLESLKNEGYMVVATVTRFTVQKGLAHMMHGAAKALQHYDKMVFLFAGDGEQRNELIQLAADLGISDKVFFTGFVRGKRWRDAYSVADVFVMSSVSEPFGLTALEAAHHSTALVISKQSGVGEVLNNIFRYDFWDTDLLADQLVGMATAPALLRQMKQDVHKEYDAISWSDVSVKCMGIYKKLTTGVQA